MDKEAYEVYTTKDYSLFKRLTGNRDISEDRIGKIVTSIQKVGWVKNPIVVNEKMEVIDGQGRLTALQRLGLPVEYIIAEGTGTEECISMNMNMVNWRQPDFIKSYAEQGNVNYQRLLSLMDLYANGNLTIIFTALHRVSRPKHRDIKDGTLQITEDQYFKAVERLKFVQPLLNQLDEKKLSGSIITLMQTLIYYYDYPEVDNDRLMSKIEKYAYSMKPYVTNEDCEREVEEIYNYYVQLEEKQSIAYLVKEERMKRKIEIGKEHALNFAEKGVQGFVKRNGN